MGISQRTCWIILFLILLFGAYLRVYHLDYPVIGYHNWKETNYLTTARNFEREGWFSQGWFVPLWDYPQLYENPSGAHSDTFSTTPLIVSLAFRIFGESLPLARGINIALALGSILFTYLIVRKLFKREDLALTTAALMTITPLLVFFGRQMDVLNSAIFFTIFGTYLYLHWIESFSWKTTIAYSFFLMLGVFTKFTFALLLIPGFFVFPFAKLKDKTLWKKYAVCLVPFFLFFSWFLYIRTVSSDLGEEISKIKPSLLFDSGFWQIMMNFFAENYSLWMIKLFVLGSIVFLAFAWKRLHESGYKFFLAYLTGSIVWFIVLAEKLMGHNYHQYPLIPLIAFMVAYLFVVVGQTIAQTMKKQWLMPATVIVLLLLLYSPVHVSAARMFDTQFYGLDVAGEYLKEHKQAGERVMHSSHQAYGLLWHADIKGTKRQKDVKLIQYGEQNLNITWLFIYQWDFDMLSMPNVSNYISDNYHLAQIGFLRNDKNINPVYFLLRKGGTFDMNKLNDYTQGKPVKSRTYERTTGKTVMNYVNVE